MTVKKVLVLGGTRFLGLRLVQALSEAGYDITLLNRGKTMATLGPTIKRLTADRRDPASIQSALKRQSFDVAYDFSGYQVRNLEPVIEALQNNIGHYIFQSTCGVYAPSDILPISEDFPRVSGASTSGAGAYGADKVQCEDYLLQTFAKHGFPITILRCPYIYGPDNWMLEREASYFVRFLKGRKILIPGNGSQFFHQVHVDDVARAHIAVSNVKQALGQAYNIAAPQATTISNYVETIAEVVGAKLDKVLLEEDQARMLQQSIFPFYWQQTIIYDICKAKTDFGFYPRYDLKAGLKNTYQWWTDKKGLAATQFTPGKMGYDVDFDYEDGLIKQYGS